MTLDDNQKQQVAQWMDEGLKLAEIQNRLESEMGIQLTYMEVRFLLDDLKLTPKETATPNTEAIVQPPAQAAAPDEKIVAPGDTPTSAGPKKVSVTVDTLTKPGSLASGKVTFSDGNTAEWYLDQMGRLGLAPQTEGYRPSAADVQEFQVALEREIHRSGL